jgi:hypothetical protein
MECSQALAANGLETLMSPIAPKKLAAEFWTDTYRGTRIAIFRRHGAWHVYLDDVLQHDVLFDSAGSAVFWLLNRIDPRNILPLPHQARTS